MQGRQEIIGKARKAEQKRQGKETETFKEFMKVNEGFLSDMQKFQPSGKIYQYVQRVLEGKEKIKLSSTERENLENLLVKFDKMALIGNLQKDLVEKYKQSGQQFTPEVKKAFDKLAPELDKDVNLANGFNIEKMFGSFDFEKEKPIPPTIPQKVINQLDKLNGSQIFGELVKPGQITLRFQMLIEEMHKTLKTSDPRRETIREFIEHVGSINNNYREDTQKQNPLIKPSGINIHMDCKASTTERIKCAEKLRTLQENAINLPGEYKIEEIKSKGLLSKIQKALPGRNTSQNEFLIKDKSGQAIFHVKISDRITLKGIPGKKVAYEDWQKQADIHINMLKFLKENMGVQFKNNAKIDSSSDLEVINALRTFKKAAQSPDAERKVKTGAHRLHDLLSQQAPLQMDIKKDDSRVDRDKLLSENVELLSSKQNSAATHRTPVTPSLSKEPVPLAVKPKR